MNQTEGDGTGPAWSTYEVCAEQLGRSAAKKLVGLVLDLVTSGDPMSDGAYRVFVREISSGSVVHSKKFPRRYGNGDEYERELRRALSSETAEEFGRRIDR